MKRLLLKKQKGVALIFFALTFGMMLTFLLVIINTGTLIYQKMRLQAAVDLAAYSAASVQASYLGNDESGEDSISAINGKILQRWTKLLEDLKSGYPGVMISGMPSYPACMAACMASSTANASRVVSLYQEAAADIEELHEEARQMIAALPEASQKAAEETLKQNISDLALSDGALSADSTTNELSALLEASNASSQEEFQNAILSFGSKKGMYLTNVVGAVPHVFPYFGPFCFDALMGTGSPFQAFYCQMNGAGAPGGPNGQAAAMAAYGRSFAPEGNGNIGMIESIGNPNANAIKLNFLENPNNPDPFVVVAAEWYPRSSTAVNMENIIAGAGDLFADRTRLVAVAAAEPFGGNLAQSQINYGTRLQSIRKLLMDPRVLPVKEDYQDVFDYMGYLSPVDSDGDALETPEQVIRRFLH